MLEVPKKSRIFIFESFDSIALQIAEIRTVTNPFPLRRQNFAKSLFINRLCQIVENLIK